MSVPTINKGKKKIPIKYKHEDKSAKYYGSPAWRDLRAFYIEHHPICEECIQYGVITPAEHIHHKKEFLKGKTDADRWQLLLDINNLEALCSCCHHAIHSIRKHHKCDHLSPKQYREAHQEYLSDEADE